jgi:hypothetical protein
MKSRGGGEQSDESKREEKKENRLCFVDGLQQWIRVASRQRRREVAGGD